MPPKLTGLWSRTQGRGHPELLLQLEGRHRLLRPGASLLPRCVRVLRPQPKQTQGQLPAGLQHGRVSAHSLYDAGDVSSAADDEDDEDVFYNLDRKLHCLIVYLSLPSSLTPSPSLQEVGRLPFSS